LIAESPSRHGPVLVGIDIVGVHGDGGGEIRFGLREILRSQVSVSSRVQGFGIARIQSNGFGELGQRFGVLASGG
jgi:hypothetical protein